MLMPSPYHQEHDRFITKYLATGVARIIGRLREVVGRRKDGTEFPMELAVSEFHDRAGKQFSGIVRDVSERKRVEGALRESEGRLRGMADAMPLLASFVDAKQRYQFNNAAYEAWFGIPRESLRGMRVRQVIGAKAYRAVREQIEAALAGRPGTFEGGLTFGDGKVRSVHVDYVPERDEKGEVTGFYSVTRDITARKQMDERERELARVLRVSTVNELASGLAHEISQPLSAIVNDLEASLKRVEAGADRARIIEMLEHATSQAKRAGEVVRHLRQFMRRREPVLETLDLRELVESVVALISRSVEQTRTSLDLDLGAGALPVQVDRVQIEQVILNLVQNAIEAMATRRGGRILEIRGEAKGGSAELSIADVGAGIAPTARERIFEPFFTTKQGGLGLGLAVSRSLVEAHRGRLTLNPRLDRRSGAVARLALPLHRAPSDGRGRTARAPRARGKGRRR
jgi:PAS domain S-box-containing protein